VHIRGEEVVIRAARKRGEVIVPLAETRRSVGPG